MHTDLDLDFGHNSIEDVIAKNQSQLAAAEEAARRCRERQYQLRRHLNHARSTLSSLPKEVMSQIFLFMCPPPVTGLSSLRPVQFLIGGVCKEWREIAWSTPRLWNNIHIQFFPKSCQTQIELLEEWIEQSGNLPLDLYIYTFELPKKLREAPTEAFTRLVEVCARWRSYDGHAVLGLAVALQRNATCFPMLGTLSLSQLIITLPVNNPPHTACEWNFLSAPALRNVSMKPPLKGGKLAVNWESLTCLTAAFFLRESADPVHREYIPFDGTHGSMVSATQQPHPCLLPHLKVLTIEGSAVIVECVLGWLKTPRLNELKIRLESVDLTSQWEDSLIDLTVRSSCKIRSLSIFHSKNELESDGDLVEMLRTLSSNHPIDSLKIYSSSDSAFKLSDNMVFLLMMKRKYDDATRKEHLPFLKSFYYDGDISLSLWEYARMINSRLTYEARKRKAYRKRRHRGANDVSSDVSVHGETTTAENGGEDDEYGGCDELEEDEENDGDQLDDSSISSHLVSPYITTIVLGSRHNIQAIYNPSTYTNTYDEDCDDFDGRYDAGDKDY